MSGAANLTPFNTLPPELHRAISSKGGKASGAARAARREEINRIKAEEIALRELDKAENSVYYLARIVRELSKAAAAQGLIEKPKRHRDGYRWTTRKRY